MLTTEELLQRRWKVIADYPRNPYKMGHIIEEALNLEGATFFEKKIHLYPHLFQLLHWHDDRTIEDLPQYLQVTDNIRDLPRFVKVDRWEMNKITPIAFFGNDFVAAWYTIPCTEAEYLTYKQQSNG